MSVACAVLLQEAKERFKATDSAPLDAAIGILRGRKPSKAPRTAMQLQHRTSRHVFLPGTLLDGVRGRRLVGTLPRRSRLNYHAQGQIERDDAFPEVGPVPVDSRGRLRDGNRARTM